MSATNGLLRSRSRLIGICMVLMLVVMAVSASAASAKPKKPAVGYVAIGDSLGFGYTQQKFEEYYPAENPANFEGGYVNVIAKKLAAKEKTAGFSVAIENFSCPGELTAGMLGHNPALGGAAGAENNPCTWHNVFGFPRHTEYGPVSQTEAMIGALTTPGAPPVHLITINMGANDELKIVSMCKEKSYDEANGFTGGPFECLVVEAGEKGHFYPGGLFAHIIHNIGTVIGVARHYGYTGVIGILGYYNPQAEILPGSDSLQKKLNEVFESVVAKGELGPGPEFNPQNKNEAARICSFTEECNEHDKKVNLEKEVGHPVTAEEAANYPVGDIHPTPLGYQHLGKVLGTALGL
jgi:hypothetical protein